MDRGALDHPLERGGRNRLGAFDVGHEVRQVVVDELDQRGAQLLGVDVARLHARGRRPARPSGPAGDVRASRIRGGARWPAPARRGWPAQVCSRMKARCCAPLVCAGAVTRPQHWPLVVKVRSIDPLLQVFSVTPALTIVVTCCGASPSGIGPVRQKRILPARGSRQRPRRRGHPVMSRFCRTGSSPAARETGWWPVHRPRCDGTVGSPRAPCRRNGV